MELKKATINGKMLDVVSYENFCGNKDLYNNTKTAVEMDTDTGSFVFPIRNQSDSRPGMYVEGPLNFYVKPDESEYEEYATDSLKESNRFIDLSDPKSISNLIEKQEMVRDIEREMLTSPDNIFKPIVGKKDTPVMAGLKEAVIEKNIDIDKYQDRFPNFANDKRQFKCRDITLKMLSRITKALDIKVTMTMSDTSPDVPNPIGKEIFVDINGYDED